MNTKILSTVKILILAGILSVGATYLYAGVWAPPASTPPLGNTDAPINTGGVAQTKVGKLVLQGGLNIPTGAASGNVLTSNASGDAFWSVPPGTITMVTPTGGSTTANSSWQTVSTGAPAGTKAVIMNLAKDGGCPDFFLHTGDMAGNVTGNYFAVGTSGDVAMMGTLAIIPLSGSGQFQFRGYGPSPSCSNLQYITLGFIN